LSSSSLLLLLEAVLEVLGQGLLVQQLKAVSVLTQQEAWVQR
jgi:hypothetical protein